MIPIEIPSQLPAAAVYDARADEYDGWFDENDALYRAELAAVEQLLTPIRAAAGDHGLEIGVGTGRFAGPLGIGHGVEPAPAMAARARERGIEVVEGIAEQLPHDDDSFAFTAFITSLCFVTDAAQALREARRVTRDGGWIVVAFLNKGTPAGAELAATAPTDPYYEHARLRTADEITDLLDRAGYRVAASRQVVMTEDGPVVRPGTDAGLFCVVSARLRSDS